MGRDRDRSDSELGALQRLIDPRPCDRGRRGRIPPLTSSPTPIPIDATTVATPSLPKVDEATGRSGIIPRPPQPRHHRTNRRVCTCESGSGARPPDADLERCTLVEVERVRRHLREPGSAGQSDLFLGLHGDWIVRRWRVQRELLLRGLVAPAPFKLGSFQLGISYASVCHDVCGMVAVPTPGCRSTYWVRSTWPPTTLRPSRSPLALQRCTWSG